MAGFALTSPAFDNGSEIPQRHGYKHGNCRPRLLIKNAPRGCRSMALIMDDPDAVGAVGRVWTHWLLWNVPPDTVRIDESALPENSLEGVTDFGETGYGGPAPPDKRHTYAFKLYALDSVLDLRAGSDKAQLEGAMRGHVIEACELTGTFAP